MTWSPQQVDERIEGAIERLEELVTDLRPLAEAAGDAKVAYELAFSKALLVARRILVAGKKPSEVEAKAEATTNTADEYAARVKAETDFDTHKRVLDVVRAQCDLLRTLAASRRAAP